ncbi:MAG: hypothetical protein IKA30_02930 [Alphaproteobacteria bacterium]|nr:hypothetical protein [Alphaproteobacteria bacterium]
MSEEKSVYNAVYGDGSYGKVTLGKMINRGGASGKIYEVVGRPESVVKIFHNVEKSATNRQKLQAMLLNKPKFDPVKANGIDYIQIAWPEALLDDEKGFCVGYMMPLIDMNKAVSLDHLMQKAIRKKLNLSEKYAYRVFAAYNVALMVTELHKCGHYIVDLKPSNLYVYKENMLVAVVDCDGFSIKGDNTRYPAEFVSEEYIYPEGLELSCEEMGEEQDKFALAVIIFRLLNNGIHPFSGAPKNNDGEMLTIQTRIEKYHYAYGLWPDKYQYPHPYSIHEYFNKETLELFERAFTKDCQRPSAYEWQEHLWKLMHSMKQCKENPNHAYFTSKGCGLCSVESKFYKDLNNIKQQKAVPEKIRGIEISQLSTEKVQEEKERKLNEMIRMQRFFVAGLIAYILFFAFLPKIISPIKEFVENISLGFQGFFIVCVLMGLKNLMNRIARRIDLLRNKVLADTLLVYAFIWMIVALVFLNDLPKDIFALAD